METLKKYADFALYQVKHSHKGCLQEFSMESYRREAQTAQLRRDFQQLLTEERVYYMFQPIFSAHDGRVMAYEALMRSDMEALRSPATIMKLAQEQGALYEIERLTFFKSLETFAHPRSMQIIAEGVETAEELKKVLELGVDGLQGYFLAKPANIPARIAPVARQIIENSHSSDCG